MESEVSEEKQQFLDTWGDFFFGYIWTNMDFTVLGRTPEGVQVRMLVVLEGRRNTDGTGKGRQEKERRLEKRELEQDMIRLSLVINLSEAVRTFFKSPKFTFQKLPPNPQTRCPCLGSYCESLCTKTETGNKKYPGPSKSQNKPQKAVHFFFTHRINNIGI